MLVSKWGNSLAVRLPAAVVEALDLQEGDDIEIQVEGARSLRVRTRQPRAAGAAAPVSVSRTPARGVPLRSARGA
jgi:antitoxin component of MazEF toxin-antitoxin module